MNTREMREQRAKLIEDARALDRKVEQEKRGLTAEERQQWDRYLSEADQLLADIERVEKLERQERELGEAASAAHRPEPQAQAASANKPDEYRAAFASWLRGGPSALRTVEIRALQADADIYGGYLVAPQQMMQGLIKAVDDQVFIRQWATKYQISGAASLGAPTLEADPADADWTSELLTGSADSTMNFGKRELHPHALAKSIKVSRKLLQKVPSAEDLVVQRLAYKFAITWEKAALTGTGAGQPLGVFTASSSGISTSRDVSTDNTTTAITADNLFNVKYALKPQYWANGRWLFHRDAVKMIAKLTDGEGQYLWQPGLQAGQPDRLLNFPVFMSEYAPNTFTTGLYVGLLGDFSWYWVVDDLNFEVQRLVELYAETNHVGMIGRLQSDGAPVLEQAFVRVKLA